MNWRRFWRRRGADVVLRQEIDLYLSEEIDENLARGMSPDEARRRAYLKFGSPQQVRESVWQQNSIALVDCALRDLKYAARTLSRSPGFALIAIAVMALGIGANIALFTVVRCVLLNPLPYRDPSQLVSLFEDSRDQKEATSTTMHPWMPAALPFGRTPPLGRRNWPWCRLGSNITFPPREENFPNRSMPRGARGIFSPRLG